MTKVVVSEEYLEDTANAIRSKNGTGSTYTPAQFGNAIRAIDTSGDTGSKTITSNGTYYAIDEHLDGYDEVTVNVPNSYSSSDEGKVVSSGALVSQTSTTKTANGTYDTTTNNSVIVNVSPNVGAKSISANGSYSASSDSLDGYSSVTVDVANSYGASDEGKVVSSGALVAQTSRNISANGTYDTTTNDSVVVDVPSGTTPSGTISISSNGTYDVTSYASADVNVSGGGSSLGTKAIVANGTYNASDDSLDGWSQVVVSVPSSGGVNFDEMAERTFSEVYTGTASFVESYAFAYHKGLQSVELPNVTSIGSNAFRECAKLSHLSLPNCTSIFGSAFSGCKSLTELHLPKVETLGNYAFCQCTSLAKVVAMSATSISNAAFMSCSALASLYMLGSTVATLGTSALASTPMSRSNYIGHFGSIYVPSSLLASYAAAANWSAYSNRLVGITDEEITAL